MRILLDTDAYSAMKRANPIVVDLVRQSEEVLLSTVVAGELLYGFRCGNRYEMNRQALAPDTTQRLRADSGVPRRGSCPDSNNCAATDNAPRNSHPHRARPRP
jgi:hypothetical protein